MNNSSNTSSNEAEFNPFRPPESMFEVKPEIPRLGRWLALSLKLFALTIVVGVVGAFIKVESIIPSGGVASALGLTIAVLSRKTGNRSGKVLGFSGPLFSLFCFVLIFFNGWNPDEAKPVIPPLILGYGIIAILGVIFSLGRNAENSALARDNNG